METPAVFKLPPPPNIIRARCPGVEPRKGGYLSNWPQYLIDLWQGPFSDLWSEFMTPLWAQYPWGWWLGEISPLPVQFEKMGAIWFKQIWPEYLLNLQSLYLDNFRLPIDWRNFLADYSWKFNISLFGSFPHMFFDIKYGNILFRDHTDTLDAPDDEELTYSSTGLKINIDGTEYSSGWGTNVSVSDALSISEYVDVTYSSTFIGQTKDGDLWKYTPNDERSSWNEAWAGMEAATPLVDTSTALIYIWFLWQYDGINEEWTAGKRRGYISFDTSSLSGKTITSATLKLDFGAESALDIITEGTLNVYQKTWDTLDTTDWNGGSLAGSLPLDEFEYNDWNEIDIDTSLINKTGETQFEIMYKEDADGYVPADPYSADPGVSRYGSGYITFHSGDDTGASQPKLIVEYE